MCEAELWDEALIELKRQSYAIQVKKEETRWLAHIYLGMGRNEEVVALKAKAKETACDIDIYLAVAYARLGQHTRAMQVAQEAIRRKRSGVEKMMGHIYTATGDHETALRWYEQAAQSVFDHSRAMRYVGQSLMALEDYPEAAFAFETAVSGTTFARVQDIQALAECYRHIGRDRKADDLEQLAQEKSD